MRKSACWHQIQDAGLRPMLNVCVLDLVPVQGASTLYVDLPVHVLYAHENDGTWTRRDPGSTNKTNPWRCIESGIPAASVDSGGRLFCDLTRPAGSAAGEVGSEENLHSRIHSARLRINRTAPTEHYYQFVRPNSVARPDLPLTLAGEDHDEYSMEN